MAKKRVADLSARCVAVTVEMMNALSIPISETLLPPNMSELLVQTLNDPRLIDVGSKARVVQLMQLLQIRQGYMSQILAGKPLESPHDPLTDALINVGLKLNHILERYRVAPQIDFIGATPGFSYATIDPATGALRNDVESTAVMTVIQLAERNQLQGIRLCRCEKFFFARRIDQCHCSAACRIGAHHSSDEFKQKRRSADRERYRLHRDAKVKETTRRNNGTKKTR